MVVVMVVKMEDLMVVVKLMMIQACIQLHIPPPWQGLGEKDLRIWKRGRKSKGRKTK